MHLAKFHFNILGVIFFHLKKFVKLKSGCQKSFKSCASFRSLSLIKIFKKTKLHKIFGTSEEESKHGNKW